jgi:diguanylate cyclase (GGDEF)-like protein/PAS domain S-box-containing protein
VPINAAAESERARLALALKDAEARYATLIGSVDAAFCVVEMIFDAHQQAVDYRFVEVNRAFATHTGLADARGKSIRELVPTIEQNWIETFATVDRTLESARFDSIVADLDQRWFEGTAFPTGDPHQHRVAVFFNNVKDKRQIESTLKQLNANLERAASESALIEEALYNEKERAQVTLNSIGDAVICTNVDGDVTYLNGAAERLTGWQGADAVGRRLEEVFHIIEAESRAVIPNPMALATAQNKVVGLPPLCILVRRDATELSIEDSAAPIHDRHGKVTGAVMVFHDVSAARTLSRQLSHQAAHDSLTDLPNRSLLNDRLAQALSAVQRHHTSLAILYLDLDRFKHINDSLGHAIGDRLLQTVALRLTECVRGSDTVSRLGGDEFVIVLIDIDDDKDAARGAEKVLQSLRAPYVLDDHELHVSASIGIAICPHDGTEVEALLRNADSAMYEAKDRGRNNFQFYRKDLNASAIARQSLESDLRHAVERRELDVHYQPIMDVHSGAMSGFEALLRWRHPKHGFTLPARFMAIAEESGLIVPIGHWVLREACSRTKAWQTAGLPRLRLSVNVSAVELRSKDFVGGVAAVLRETGLDPAFLELELTETFLMQDSKSTAVVLKSLKSLGLHLALDDFGTGYSSLSYMRRFPIDALKIDRSFVSDLTTDADDATVVNAVIHMGKSLHMRVVAEGVETRDQLSFLERHDCPEAQGFFFSHPLEPDQFATLLRQGAAASI